MIIFKDKYNGNHLHFMIILNVVVEYAWRLCKCKWRRTVSNLILLKLAECSGPKGQRWER